MIWKVANFSNKQNGASSLDDAATDTRIKDLKGSMT